MQARSDQTIVVDADTSAFQSAMDAAADSTKNFGQIFTSTIRKSITSGKGLEDTLKTLAMRLSNMALNSALAPLEKGASNLINGLISSVLSPKPFAKGGVVNSPTMFTHGAGLGLMGEAGPEAIMPLTRGSDGKLGIAGGVTNSKPVNVVFNVQASDTDSFKRSESQLTAMLARTVQRGSRKI